jgi:predicted alpha/beta hydrolase family esterase
MRYVIAPGFEDSDAGHWQTAWQADLGADAVRMSPSSWTEPKRKDWVRALNAVMSHGAVIVAHSLGCLTAVEWMTRHPGVAAGAFLVALPDPDGADFPAAISGFRPPGERLDEALLMVGSSNDPFAGWDFTQSTATILGAPLVGLGAAGHISTAAGYGAWPEGRALLARFVAGLPTPG